MQEAFEAADASMPHLIGEGMGHAYHPGVAAEVGRRIDRMVAHGVERLPERCSLQTRTLRYGTAPRMRLLGLAKHWEDSRLDADFGQAVATVTASPNVLAFALEAGPLTASFVVNGVPLAPLTGGRADCAVFARAGPADAFTCVADAPACDMTGGAPRKVPGLQVIHDRERPSVASIPRAA